ncbi:putative ferric-chelate reductase 1 homolog [Diachasma alloeum]|uniref:putative ferric-chelate reductase 1 homolog n=1 Tax=Diachasma alloeum TaxID=454923 RepID=UPI0007384718|nr:putative ferric-chelate reductase 1 homolog [Diachasma alloeum]XP_015126560.1 putative ferric-chelate reductase 1 homolog [Diachasma alloeum]
MNRLRLSLLLTLTLSSVTLALRNGAPPDACGHLTPRHPDTTATQSYPPYQILPAAGQGRIRVILGSPQGLAYQGFIINARSADTGEYVGEFTNLPDNVKAIECTPGLKNGVTHTDTSEKHNIEFDWEAPADYEGMIIFNSTFAQDYSTYWVGIESPRITVLGRSIEVMTSPTPPPTERPTTPPYYEAPVAPESNEALAQKRAIYTGCGTTKSCFGVPSNCVDSQDCKAVVTVSVQGERYIFELQGEGGKYVAVGLSEDAKMGDDSVVECVENSGKIFIHHSWNTGHKNDRLPSQSGILNLEHSSFVDNRIYCKFTRERRTVIKGHEFDIENKAYHLLIAMGKDLKQNGVGYHNLREASAEARRLSDVARIAATDDVLIRVHGALMIASWIGTASVGILMARYYKQTWLRSSLCGKDQWFAWHRFFMILTWAMTIAGFVVIFVEIGTWSSATVHASLGVVTTALAFIQPFMAALRPHPGTPRRPLFNWAHWFVGNAAHICAIVALFFAVRLTKAKIPDWVDYVLAAYVVFHVVTHIVLSFAGCASDRQDSQRINAFPMKDLQRGSMGHPDARRDAPLAAMRKSIFAIYFIVIAVFVAALVVIVVLAPIEDSWAKFTDNF